MVQGVTHPDRVAWYGALVAEWTGHVPQVVVLEAIGLVVACVGGYVSQVGMIHAGDTVAYGEDVEHALEHLANQLYADLHADIQRVQAVEVGFEAVGVVHGQHV